ncbi:MAG: hypothetical protein H7319_12190, partial [Spirosoma sp.]|nr:hypothetical protein [Spirosoma sp.]
MTFRTTTAITLLGLGLHTANAQSSLRWHEGDVTLSIGITLHGELGYQPHSNALVVRIGDKWRTYSADQLQGFRYTDVDSNYSHQFRVYETAGPDMQSVPLIFNELVPGQSVALLQLPGQHGATWLAQHRLPRCQKVAWQTPECWFIWIEGRFVSPDAFVETELDSLVAAAPESVQRWSASTTRPTNPKTLIFWLSRYNGQLARAKSPSKPDSAFW